ncbi:hypothetical protein DCO58_11715 [Helicobacter saguini]|uniref:Uncharacterized protein n=1 Tax=Helicobacter saguini TaxID=1548018 RepID=A0A347VQ79_9HELI|nr:hypothetical protein [Helicobacter saguini]MWV61043.1 hypothetical protein [Helicobacter saguini]MWV68288.1 hypothetical protein [Helicobacter saguini]MWV70247.1 hypothetical protein [Helicobacter saguini]MWV72150.1 hypothetical protein [Helicobacter saguini]TLD95212.1 hypothetical protein LS64_002275 [Helicobacter saguini]
MKSLIKGLVSIATSTLKLLKESLEINTSISSKEIVTKQRYKVNTKSQKNEIFSSDKNTEDSIESNDTFLNQNVTKVNQNVTLPIHYNIQNTITMFEKHSVDIAEKPLTLEETLHAFLKNTNAISLKEINNYKFALPKAFIDKYDEILPEYTKEAENIKLSPQIAKKIDSKTLASLSEFISKFNYLHLPKAKKELIETIESMVLDNSLEINLKICKENNLITLCNPSEIESKSKQALSYLKELWNLLLVRINVTKKGLIQQIKEVYKEKLLDFITFRESKRRYFSTYSFDALCLRLAEFEANGIDVVKAIEQSIQRDYNWVFPPTHRKPKFHNYKRYPKRKYTERIA